MQYELNLKLNNQQALVFFEWLNNIEEIEACTFQHSAEQKVVWKLQGQLESALQELFLPNYIDLLAEARQIVESDNRAGS